MKLLIGLGNPGKQYENTRHNVGYMVIDKIKNQKSKIKNAMFVKTGVFMNESGVAVKRLISQYPNIPVSQLYIVHDDLDIPLGQFKIQFGKGPKDHKGIQSVEEALRTSEFWRVRVGIEHRAEGGEQRASGEEYVLQEFTDEEREVINKVIEEVVQTILKHKPNHPFTQ